MRLQVQVLPLQDRRFAGKASSPSINQNQQHSNLPQGALSFLEICDDSITLDELCSKLCVRFARIYPHKPPLNIKKLQDVYENDLDLVYTVGDVFDDKSADQQNSVVRVLQAPTTRDSSVPPQSALRPHIHSFAGRKRVLGGLGNSRDITKVGCAEGGSPEPKAGRASKRRRFQELVEDEEEEVDPDRPIPSKELNPKDMAKPTQLSGNEPVIGQENLPNPAKDTSGVNSRPFDKLNHQILSDTLTVPESPINQGRHQVMDDQSSQANGLASDPDDESAKSESVDDDNGLLHSIPRSSICSPFPEGEGIIGENLAITSQDLLPSLPTPRAQGFRSDDLSGRPQSIITPSDMAGISAPIEAHSSNKLKRPNPSMFKSSSRSTGSTEGSPGVYDAIETDEEGSPSLWRPAKRAKRHNSFTSIMNGQSPRPKTSGNGKNKRSPGRASVATKRHERKSISPSEVKWLRDHEGFCSQSHAQGKRNPENGSSSNHTPNERDKGNKANEWSTKEQIQRDSRVKAMEEEGKKALAEAERERLENEAEANTQKNMERIKQQKQREGKENQRRADERVRQQAEESRRKEEEDRRARETNERHQKEADDKKRNDEEDRRAREIGGGSQKEADDKKRKEEEDRKAQEITERRQKEADARKRKEKEDLREKGVKDKEEAARLERVKREEKRLGKERQSQERKEQAQRIAQAKALKAEKVEKEAEAKRLAKKKEEKALGEATEKAGKTEKEVGTKRLAKKKQEKTVKETAEKAEKNIKETEVKMLANTKEEMTVRDPAGTAVEQAGSGEKGKMVERVVSTATESTRNGKLKGGRRMSTTPLFPRAVTSKDALLNGYGSGSVPKAPVRDAGLDPQMSISSEQGASMRRSVSFQIDESPQPASNPMSSSPKLVDPAPALTPNPALLQVPRKVTKVYPPGMGPDSLASPAPVPAQQPVSASPRPKGKSPPSSNNQTPKARTSSNLRQSSTKGKATDGKPAQNPVPKSAPKPESAIQEIVISSESDSGSSYHSDTDSGNENSVVLATAKRIGYAAASTAKADDKEGVLPEPGTATSESQSRPHPEPPSRGQPRISSPTRSPVRFVTHTPSESSSYDSVSASRSPQSESSPSSRSGSSSPTHSRSRSDSTGEASSDDEDTEDDVSTSLQSSSRPSSRAAKKISGNDDEAISDISSGSKEAANLLNSALPQSAQHSTRTRGKPSSIRSPLAGSSSQAKPSLNSFPSLSQLGSQSFDHNAQNIQKTPRSHQSLPRNGSRGGNRPTPVALPEDSGSSSGESSSNDDNGDDNGLPKDRRAGNSEPNNKVARGLKGLISGMLYWRSSQGAAD
ncbi:hypothetical protein FGG08_007217 [Glutinoglossum americanum]|uniref:Nucleolar protein Dnt1-like N-terminal domain-containing protein n=1 Tax=Glutinoglossum americanum TaxID=1670608 RepID=A0A9P8KWP2_9PEZI|nr:hypothetical protein FGG08_007217 [Glutinoglossum americanum]